MNVYAHTNIHLTTYIHCIYVYSYRSNLSDSVCLSTYIEACLTIFNTFLFAWRRFVSLSADLITYQKSHFLKIVISAKNLSSVNKSEINNTLIRTKTFCFCHTVTVSVCRFAISLLLLKSAGYIDQFTQKLYHKLYPYSTVTCTWRPCGLPVSVRNVMDMSRFIAQLKAETTDTAFPLIPVGKISLKTT